MYKRVNKRVLNKLISLIISIIILNNALCLDSAFALSTQSTAESFDVEMKVMGSLIGDIDACTKNLTALIDSNAPITEEEEKLWFRFYEKEHSVSVQREIHDFGYTTPTISWYILAQCLVIAVIPAIAPNHNYWVSAGFVGLGIFIKVIHAVCRSIKERHILGANRANSLKSVIPLFTKNKADSQREFIDKVREYVYLVGQRINGYLQRRAYDLYYGKNPLEEDAGLFELSGETKHDLEMFHKAKVFNNLIEKRTCSALGAWRLKYLVSNPPVDPEVINKRREVVEELVNNASLRSRLRHDLLLLKNHEEPWNCPYGNELAKVPFMRSYLYSDEIIKYLNKLSLVRSSYFVKHVIYKEIFIGNSYDPGTETKYLQFKKLLLAVQGLQNSLQGVQSHTLQQIAERIFAVKNLKNVIPLMEELESVSERKLSKKKITLQRLELGKNISEYFINERVRLMDALSAISELDAFYALADLSSQKAYTTPIMRDDEFPVFILTNAHNPYVYDTVEKSDPVSMRFDEKSRILMVTGPQGSGKSTLSQMIGWLTILAQLGSRVPVQHMEWTPTIFAVSVDPQGDQERGKSHSIAQIEQALQHLEYIQATAGQKKRCMLILDEVFAGVNSHEKPAIELGYLHYLLSQHNVAVIYTTQNQDVAGYIEEHIEEEFTGVVNKHFGDEDEEGKFSHELHDGPAKLSSMNAIRIMERMGFPKNITDWGKKFLQDHGQPNTVFLQRDTATACTRSNLAPPGNMRDNLSVSFGSWKTGLLDLEQCKKLFKARYTKKLGFWRWQASVAHLLEKEQKLLLQWVPKNERSSVESDIERGEQYSYRPACELEEVLFYLHKKSMDIRADLYNNTGGIATLQKHVLGITEKYRLMAHGTAHYRLKEMRPFGIEYPALFDHWAILNIMIEGKLRTKGGVGYLKRNEHNPYGSSYFGPYYIIFDSSVEENSTPTPFQDTISADHHMIYLVPKKNDVLFLINGLKKAVKLQFLSLDDAYKAISKIMTYQEFVDHQKDISSIIKGKKKPVDIIIPKISLQPRRKSMRMLARSH